MTRFRKPTFLKVFERSGEKDNVSLLKDEESETYGTSLDTDVSTSIRSVESQGSDRSDKDRELSKSPPRRSLNRHGSLSERNIKVSMLNEGGEDTTAPVSPSRRKQQVSPMRNSPMRKLQKGFSDRFLGGSTDNSKHIGEITLSVSRLPAKKNVDTSTVEKSPRKERSEEKSPAKRRFLKTSSGGKRRSSSSSSTRKEPKKEVFLPKLPENVEATVQKVSAGDMQNSFAQFNLGEMLPVANSPGPKLGFVQEEEVVEVSSSSSSSESSCCSDDYDDFGEETEEVHQQVVVPDEDDDGSVSVVSEMSFSDIITPHKDLDNIPTMETLPEDEELVETEQEPETNESQPPEESSPENVEDSKDAAAAAATVKEGEDAPDDDDSSEDPAEARDTFRDDRAIPTNLDSPNKAPRRNKSCTSEEEEAKAEKRRKSRAAAVSSLTTSFKKRHDPLSQSEHGSACSSRRNIHKSEAEVRDGKLSLEDEVRNALGLNGNGVPKKKSTEAQEEDDVFPELAVLGGKCGRHKPRNGLARPSRASSVRHFNSKELALSSTPMKTTLKDILGADLAGYAYKSPEKTKKMASLKEGPTNKSEDCVEGKEPQEDCQKRESKEAKKRENKSRKSTTKKSKTGKSSRKKSSKGDFGQVTWQRSPSRSPRKTPSKSSSRSSRSSTRLSASAMPEMKALCTNSPKSSRKKNSPPSSPRSPLPTGSGMDSAASTPRSSKSASRRRRTEPSTSLLKLATNTLKADTEKEPDLPQELSCETFRDHALDPNVTVLLEGPEREMKDVKLEIDEVPFASVFNDIAERRRGCEDLDASGLSDMGVVAPVAAVELSAIANDSLKTPSDLELEDHALPDDGIREAFDRIRFELQESKIRAEQSSLEVARLEREVARLKTRLKGETFTEALVGGSRG